MPINMSFANATFPIPAQGERNWTDAVNGLLQQLCNYALSPYSGTFTLQADLNFGTLFGIKAKYYISQGTNPASAGVFRLANTDTINWRNLANSADLTLGVGAGNRLFYQGDVLVSQLSTDTLQNKTLTAAVFGGLTVATLASFQDLTLFNQLSFTQLASDPASPSAGFIYVYSKTDNRIYKKTSVGVVTEIGAGGSGSGIKNYVKNPNDAAANWTASDAGITVVTESTASNLPDNATQTTGIKITRVSGNTSYAFTRWIMDVVDYTVIGQIILDALTAAAAGAYEVQLWTNTASNYGGTSAQVTLSGFAISGPKFAPTGQAGNATAPYMELRIVARTAAGTTPLYLNNVTYTPTVVYIAGTPLTYLGRDTSLTTSGFGTIASVSVDYWQSANRLQARGRFTTGTVAASNAAITLRNGLLADVGVDKIVGRWWRNSASASTRKVSPLLAQDNSGVIFFTSDDYTTAAPPNSAILGNSAAGTGEIIFFEFDVAVTAWAGQTLTQGLGANLQIYSSTTGTWDAAAAVGNTVPGLSPISGSLTATRNKVVRLPFAPQSISDVKIVFLPTGYTAPIGQEGWAPLLVLPSVSYGAQIVALSGTDVTVAFYQYRAQGTSYNTAAGSTNWGTGDGAWGLVVANPTAPVGVKLAGTDGSPGYAQAGSLPGSVAGTAIAAGMIGESLEATGSVLCGTGSYSTSATLTLTTGIWLVSGSFFVSNAAGSNGAIGQLFIKGSNAASQPKDMMSLFNGATGAAGQFQAGASFASRVVVVAAADADKTILIKGQAWVASTTVSAYIAATRIG